VRRQRVAGAPSGASDGSVLVAVFPLSCGVAYLQLQDEGDLPRGGVYLGARDDPDLQAFAPRFDELLAGGRALPAPARRALAEVLLAARDLACQTRPQLTPQVLAEIRALLTRAADLDAEHPPGRGLRAEELVAAALLIFVSEEERYPPPRYRGSALALERFLEAVGASPVGELDPEHLPKPYEA
jgi:hypothetical protein